MFVINLMTFRPIPKKKKKTCKKWKLIYYIYQKNGFTKKQQHLSHNDAIEESFLFPEKPFNF